MACSRSHSRYLKKNLLAVSTCVILNNQWAHATNWSFRLYSLRRNRFVPKLRYLTHKANTTAFRTTNTTVRALSRCLPQLSLGISTSRNDPVPRRERMHQSCSPTQWPPTLESTQAHQSETTSLHEPPLDLFDISLANGIIDCGGPPLATSSNPFLPDLAKPDAQLALLSSDFQNPEVFSDQNRHEISSVHRHPQPHTFNS